MKPRKDLFLSASKLILIIILFAGAGFLSHEAAFSKPSSADRVEGHSINVDKDASDWVGTPPIKENTYHVSKGEFIYKDAGGDDTGDGDYTYPLDKAFGRCADLREFRVTFDDENVYFLIRYARPEEYWAPYCLIGVDRDGALGRTGGLTVLAEGDINYISTDEGTYSELKVAERLSCGLVIGIFSCYKGRIWNARGKLIARKQADEYDTPGFMVDDDNITSVEVAIPQKIIGDPRGKTWHFIVATGLEDSGHLRELAQEQSEWFGGGGVGDAEEGEVDPDIYDLASPSKATQERELSSYDKKGKRGDEEAFATINKSYLTVRFAD